MKKSPREVALEMQMQAEREAFKLEIVEAVKLKDAWHERSMRDCGELDKVRTELKALYKQLDPTEDNHMLVELGQVMLSQQLFDKLKRAREVADTSALFMFFSALAIFILGTFYTASYGPIGLWVLLPFGVCAWGFVHYISKKIW